MQAMRRLSLTNYELCLYLLYASNSDLFGQSQSNRYHGIILNGEVDEQIYMKQHISFEVKENEHKVCRLKLSLYGLMQTSWQWNLKINQAATLLVLKIEEDHRVYVKRSKDCFMIHYFKVEGILLARFGDAKVVFLHF